MEKRTRTRDDFLTSTVQKLRDRAGNVCSFPGCYVNTHGAASTGAGTVGIGVACHITAASPGGPRYDANLNKAERSNIDNGIWMCQTHSKLIDADDSAYSIETLKEWKKTAENRSNEQLNKKSFTESELKVATEKSAFSVMNRWVNRSEDPLDTPIAEIFGGYKEDLEALDSRFTVEIDKIGKSINHTIQAAQENVQLKFIIEDLDKLQGFWEAEKALFEEGRELEIPGNHVKIEGSKLFDAIHKKANSSGQGYLKIGAVKKSLSATLFIRNDEGQERIVDTFPFNYTSGSIRTVFEGKALGGFFSINASCLHDEKRTIFNITFDLYAWVGKSVRELPKFALLDRAAELLAKGRLVVEMEVFGNIITFDTSSTPMNENFHEELRWLIHCISLARQVSELCKKDIITAESILDVKTFVTIENYLRLSKGPIPIKVTPGFLCEGKLSSHDQLASKELENQTSLLIIKSVETEPTVFNIFGTKVLAPRLVTTYEKLGCTYFTDLESPSNPKLNIYAIDSTSASVALETNDTWDVL